MVRRLARAADDGYRSELAPGLHAVPDAERLALELGRSAARLDALGAPGGAPGAYGAAARLGADGRFEDGLWLAFQIAVLGPLDEPDPFAEIERVAVGWASGELPQLKGSRFGRRGAGDPARALSALGAYRAWAARSGGQAAALVGQPTWTAERRFDRAFERLALPGLGRGPRFEFLLSAGLLGLASLRPAGLQLLADPRDATVLAAKRVFGIGDPLLCERRAAALAEVCALPVAALDLALVDWARPADGSRVSGGVSAQPDPEQLELARAALGLGPVGESDAA